MKYAARAVRMVFYAIVVLGCLAQDATAQLAEGNPTANFNMTDWVTGVNNATDIEFMPDGRGIITRRAGQLVVVDKDGMFIKNPTMPTFTGVDSTSEKGVLGVVRDENDNLYFYVSNGPSTADKHRVYKGTIAADSTITVDPANPIVTGGLEGPANHDGGGMIIYKGQLYIGVGDTGANNTPPVNKYGACLNKPNGKILRVNLDGSIPSDNPLSNLTAVTGCMIRNMGNYEMLPPDKRIYAWGFRNPWRFWIDPRTDLLWVGDVGEATQEEITVGGKGSHHGWPFVEGTVDYPMALGGIDDCMQMTPATACVAPQDTYGHTAFMGRNAASVTGGLSPRTGCGWGDYENKYFFGDYNRGQIWTLDFKPDRSGAVPGSRALFATLGRDSVVSFKNGPDGGMYLVSNSQGSVTRIVPKSVPTACAPAMTTTPPDAGGAGGTPGTGGSSGAGGMAGGSGTGGSAGAGTGGSAGAGTGGNAGTGTAPPPPSESGGCSCSLSGRSSGALAVGMVLFVAATIILRRRRRR